MDKIGSDFVKTNPSYPVLLMGKAVADFKRVCDYPIIKVTNPDEIRDMVSYYNSITRLDRPLIIEDLAFLSSSCDGLLLKFVEESKLKLILLSTYDKATPVLLSRVKKVIKYYDGGVSSEFMKVSEGTRKLEELLSPDSHYYDKVRYMGKYCPRLYLVEKAIKSNRNRNKIKTFID